MDEDVVANTGRNHSASPPSSKMSTNGGGSVLPVHNGAQQTPAEQTADAKPRGANRSTKAAGKLKLLPEQPDPLSQSRIIPGPLLPTEALAESPIAMRDDRAGDADAEDGADEDEDEDEETSSEQQDLEDVEVRWIRTLR